MVLQYITWNADPEIFSIGSFALRWYGLLFASGFYVGYLIMRKFFKIEKIPQKLLDTLAIYMILGSLLGARLGHCLFYEPDYYLANPWEIIKPWSGRLGENAKIGIQGLASHGGGIGVLIALYLFSRKAKSSYIWILDRIAIVTALAGSFIRLGNLMNSEIVGLPTDLPWAFVFTRLQDGVPRHPSQLYEAISYLIIFIFLYRLYVKNQGKFRNGLTTGWFLVTVFFMRFLIEFLKKDQVDFESTMALNMGQILSIPFVLLGITILIWPNITKSPPKVTSGKAALKKQP
jgi:phosphatidylglycerol---prolipoprotein diacylglyceryl transferase